jgi:hypothetical protein
MVFVKTVQQFGIYDKCQVTGKSDGYWKKILVRKVIKTIMFIKIDVDILGLELL